MGNQNCTPRIKQINNNTQTDEERENCTEEERKRPQLSADSESNASIPNVKMSDFNSCPKNMSSVISEINIINDIKGSSQAQSSLMPKRQHFSISQDDDNIAISCGKKNP